MPLPKQVRNQIDEANLAMATPAAPVEPPVAATAAPEPAPAPAAEPKTVPLEQYARLDQQLKSLQGIHKSIDTDRARLRTEVATLSGTVQDLQHQVEAAKAAPPAAAPSALTPEEIVEYTPELLSVIERKAQEALGPAIAAERQRAEKLADDIQKVSQRNQQLEQLLANVSKQTSDASAEKFVSTIGTLLTDWEAVNNDPAFMDWLNTYNPLTGRQYAVDFYAARDRFDAVAVVEYFKTYRATVAKPRQAPPSLDLQISPESGGGANPQPRAKAKIWTQADIASFFRDKAQGKYAKNPQQARAMEADLFAAQTENRIVA